MTVAANGVVTISGDTAVSATSTTNAGSLQASANADFSNAGLFTNQGNIEFYHLKSSVEQAPSPFKIGDKALSMALLTDDSFTDKGVKFVVNSFSANKLIHTHSGKTLLVQPNFFAKYNNDIREIIPQIDFPLGRSALTIDEQQAPLSHLAFAIRASLFQACR